MRFLEFFAANLRNPHTRRAYARAVAEFLACKRASAWEPSIVAVQPVHELTMTTPFEALPRRIFLDWCTAQFLGNYGGYIMRGSRFSKQTALIG